MVIVELIGSISLAIAVVGAVAFAIIHIKNKQNDITYIHDRPLNNIEQSEIVTNQLQEEIDQSSAGLPFEEFNRNLSITPRSETITNKELSIINVITNDGISSSPIKYGIQWTLPLNEVEQVKIIPSSSNILKPSEFDQGDSVSFSDQSTSVKNLIEKFENNRHNSTRKLDHKTFYNNQKEKNNQTDSDLTSIDTNFDNQTIKSDLNENKQKISHHSSISNLDVTIPSNLSSSIDLEQFECFSTTSNISEFLNIN